MRGFVLGVAVLAAVMGAGCAKRSPTLAQVEGSEPQRLAFGLPRDVQQIFLAKAKQCWLATPGGILAGARLDTTPNSSNSGPPVDQVTVIVNGSRGIEAFTVEFLSFNENTLIATRNRGFPPPLAVQLKRDVETWIFERPGCDSGDPDETLRDSSLKASGGSSLR